MVITLALMFFIGKAFYDLADKYNKHRWGFAILGVVSYYGGTFLAGIILGVLVEVGTFSSIDDIPEWILTVIAFPVGVLSCWGLYKILKNQWSKTPSRSMAEEVLDGDLTN
jgi:hypothetical protein